MNHSEERKSFPHGTRNFLLTYLKPLNIIEIMSSDRVTIKIPRPLYNKLRDTIEGSGFSSVNEFIVYVLRDLIALHKADDDKLTPQEIRILKGRLKKLGYL